MTIALGKPSVHGRSGVKPPSSWFGIRAAPEERPAGPDRPYVKLRRRPQHLVTMVILVFYIVCAFVVVGAPYVPDMAILASP